MDFNYTEEQGMLRDTIARYLSDHYSFEKQRAAVLSSAGWRPECWKAFAELGILAASLPEELGGLGGGGIENMIIMEEFGKALVVEPFLGTAVIGGGFLRHDGGALARELCPGIASGDVVIAFAQAEPQSRFNLAAVSTTARKDGNSYVLNGVKAAVVGAPWATHLIVTARTGGSLRERAGITVFLVDKQAKGVKTVDYPTVDGSRASEVTFDNVAVGREAVIGREGEGLELVEQVVDEAIAALCAEAVGGMRKMLADTVDYARQRKQFGVPLSTFQVLQHRMADMFVAVEQSESLTAVATMKLVAPAAERIRAASAAKVYVGKSAKLVGQSAVQIHGGMGVTEELAVGHYFKRATIFESQFGSVDHHLRRYAALSPQAA